MLKVNVGIVRGHTTTLYNFIRSFHIPAYRHSHIRNDVDNWSDVAVSGSLLIIEAPGVSLTYRRETGFYPLHRFYNFWNSAVERGIGWFLSRGGPGFRPRIALPA
jgi:hypothetical protein